MSVEIAEKIKPTLLFIKKAVSQRKKHVTSSSILSVIALAHLNGEDEERLTEFCRILIDGISIHEHDSAVIKLRDQLMGHKKTGIQKVHCALAAFLKFEPLKYWRSSTKRVFKLPESLVLFGKPVDDK